MFQARTTRITCELAEVDLRLDSLERANEGRPAVVGQAKAAGSQPDTLTCRAVRTTTLGRLHSTMKQPRTLLSSIISPDVSIHIHISLNM